MVSTTASLAIETTVMAVRESIMDYFKGSCVERMTKNTNVYTLPVETNLRGRPNYERVEIQNRSTTIILLGGLPIVTVEHLPDTITINTGVMKRSKQLRAVNKQLAEFLKVYLPGVAVTENVGVVTYG